MWDCSYTVVICGLLTACLMPALQGHVLGMKDMKCGSKRLQVVLKSDWEKCISGPTQGHDRMSP